MKKYLLRPDSIETKGKNQTKKNSAIDILTEGKCPELQKIRIFERKIGYEFKSKYYYFR